MKPLQDMTGQAKIDLNLKTAGRCHQALDMENELNRCAGMNGTSAAELNCTQPADRVPTRSTVHVKHESTSFSIWRELALSLNSEADS